VHAPTVKHAPVALVPLAVLLVLGPGVGAAMATVAVTTVAVIAALCLECGGWTALARGPRAWFAALVVWAALDAAVRPVATWDAAGVVASGVVALGIVIATATPRTAAWARLAAVLAGVGAGAWLVVERIVRGARPSGPLGNPNLAATLALLALALAPFLRARAWLRGVLVTLGALGIVASGSRAALIGVVAVVLVWGLALRGRRWVVLAAAALAVVAVLGLAIRLATDRDPLRYERLRIWGVGVRTVAAEFPLGCGPSGYADAALPHNFPRNGEFARFARLPDVAESDVLELAATLGVVGVLLGAGGVASVARVVPRNDARAWGVIAAVAATSAFNSQLMIPVLAWVVALVVGGVLPRCRSCRRGFRSVPGAAILLALAVAAGVALAAPESGKGVSPVVLVDGAEASLRTQVNDDASLADAEALAWQACSLRPRFARAWRALGAVRLRRATLRDDAHLADAAADAFARARLVNPLDAWAALGEAQARRITGDTAGAWRALNAALQLEPNLVSAWLEKAVLYLSAGQMGAARAALARAELTARDAPRATFVSAYERALAWADPQTVARLRSATGGKP
jgi:hypothetical protein